MRQIIIYRYRLQLFFSFRIFLVFFLFFSGSGSEREGLWFRVCLGVIGFVMRIAWVYVGGGNIRVRLGRVGVMWSSRLRCQELRISGFWSDFGSGWCLGWI